MGTQSVAEYCREIETYLCQKNDGHLIRVVGPSFELVSGWAARGLPLKVAFAGIDRSFERYYRKGPRRRPVKIDFCEADVLDVFDEWRKAVGVTEGSIDSPASSSERRHSLPAHLERVVTRLTSARATGALGVEFDPLIDQIANELEHVRAAAGGLRGEARKSVIARLAALERELAERARGGLDTAVLAALTREADRELAPFRAGMMPDAFADARSAALDRLVRERLKLPIISFT